LFTSMKFFIFRCSFQKKYKGLFTKTEKKRKLVQFFKFFFALFKIPLIVKKNLTEKKWGESKKKF